MQNASRFRRPLRVLVGLVASLGLTACIYKMDVQQGNLLDEQDVAQVEVGMTRSQVQFLLGTPMIADTFHRDRWDYPYYRVHGRHREVEKRWVVVYFQDGRVARVERDLELQPSS